MSQDRFVRQLNWNAPIEDWTPPNVIGDKWVFWTCCVLAVLVLVW